MIKYTTFASFDQVMQYADQGGKLFYHAPMDPGPGQVWPVMYEPGRLRVTSKRPDADPFWTDASHLDRFLRIDHLPDGGSK